MNIKNRLFFFLFIFVSTALFAAPGDTTFVRTFSYDDGRQAAWSCKKGKFLFPDGSTQYEKILMYYSLKCDPTQSPGCGEWDYIFHTELHEPTGVDSEGDPVYKVWKLGTYVTPYGNGLSMGDGWTWIYDVSDFVHLLKDSVILQDCNFQELLEITFAFIEGTPPREVIEIRDIWSGTYNLSNFDLIVKDTTIALSTDVKQVKVRTTVTGHDFDNPSTCAEFCHNIHRFKSNGQVIREWDILMECADNPLYPQGGTWIYDRAGWCPGTPGKINEFELTEYITDNSINFDYDIESDTFGIYRTYIYMVTYGEMNHQDDASAELIIAPSDNPLQKRFNPTCGKPVVVIKNIGSNPLRNVEIEYGFENGNIYRYLWQGSLPFSEIDTVELPAPDWGEITESTGVFYFKLLNPNGENDPTPYNNLLASSFKTATIVPTNKFRFLFKTNHAPEETTWKIYNMSGEILYRNEAEMTANTTYTTEIELENGGYCLVIDDAGHDGLKFWANMPPYEEGTAGSAVLRRELNGSFIIFHSFQADFGKSIQLYFIANEYQHNAIVPLYEISQLRLFPNPAQQTISIDLSNIEKEQLSLDIYDSLGKKMMSKQVIGGQINQIDIASLINGVYIAVLNSQEAIIGRAKFAIIH